MNKLIARLEEEKANLHFLMRANIWNISTGKIKEGFEKILKETFGIDCEDQDAIEQILNYGKEKKDTSDITYKEMYEEAKKAYEEYKDDYNYVGIRFENKERNIGDICNNSKANIDRDDIRYYPAYGTDEYNNLPELGGACAYDLSDYRAYDWDKKRADKTALSQIETKHCYIVVGDEITLEYAEDDAEIIIKDAKVMRKLF